MSENNIWKKRSGGLRHETGLSFRGFCVCSMIRVVCRFLCSQSENFTSMKVKPWECEECKLLYPPKGSQPTLSCRCPILTIIVVTPLPSGLTESVLWVFLTQKFILSPCQCRQRSAKLNRPYMEASETNCIYESQTRLTCFVLLVHEGSILYSHYCHFKIWKK